jgi:hypothetical protein
MVNTARRIMLQSTTLGAILTLVGAGFAPRVSHAYTTGQTYLAANSSYVFTQKPQLAGSIPNGCADARVVISNDTGYYMYFETPSVGLSGGNWTLDLTTSGLNYSIPYGIYHVDVLSKCGNASYADPLYADRYIDAMHVYPYVCHDPNNTWASGGTYCVPYYKFLNPSLGGSYFYTTSQTELRQAVRSSYTYEGIAGFVQSNGGVDLTHTWRFYNKNTGTHFYTSSWDEADYVMRNNANIYRYEGLDYAAYPVQAALTIPVYRFYSTQSGRHVFTESETQKAGLVNGGFRYEGIAYYIIANS